MKDLDINFPLDKFEKLIIDIGWESLDDWVNFWNNKRNILSIDQYWKNKVNDDWIWGLALPLLSQAYKFQNYSTDRKIIGISALPGTGKTTLGKWLEAISLKLNFKIAVISIDDFYLDQCYLLSKVLFPKTIPQELPNQDYQISNAIYLLSHSSVTYQKQEHLTLH